MESPLEKVRRIPRGTPHEPSRENVSEKQEDFPKSTVISPRHKFPGAEKSPGDRIKQDG